MTKFFEFVNALRLTKGTNYLIDDSLKSKDFGTALHIMD